MLAMAFKTRYVIVNGVIRGTLAINDDEKESKIVSQLKIKAYKT